MTESENRLSLDRLNRRLRRRNSFLSSDRRGAMMAMVLVLLPVLLIIAAFAVNLAHIESTNTEIQIACDAAARSAGRVYSLTGDRSQALAAAREAAELNPIAKNVVLKFADTDLTVGTSARIFDDGTYEFTPSFLGNSIQISTQSLASGSGAAVKPLLPIFGMEAEIRPALVSISTQSDIDIALVIDRSGSMAYGANEVAQYPPVPAAAPPGWDFGAPVPPQSRWLDLVAAVDVFVDALGESHQQELVSLSLYNDKAETVLDLTSVYERLSGPLDGVSAVFGEGGTNIGGGMLQGLSTLDASGARSDAAKVIILLTDGVHNYGQNPIYAADTVASKGVTIFTITFSDEARQADMQSVADIGGGRHFHAKTGAGLKQAFIDISKHLPNLITK